MKGRVRKQGSKPFVNPDKRTGRLSGSAEKPTSKRIKLAATIVETSESALVPNSPAPEGRVTFFQKRQQPRRRRLAFGAFYLVLSLGATKFARKVTPRGKSSKPDKQPVPRQVLATLAPRGRRSRYPRCLRAACAMLAHTAAAKHSMMAPQARNTT